MCKQCGACCHLDPGERPDLDEYLLPDELGELYLSMVGEGDGVLITTTLLMEYPNPSLLSSGITGFWGYVRHLPWELNDFAIDCCRQQIYEFTAIAV